LFHAGVRSAIAYPVTGYFYCTRRTSSVGAPTRDPTMTLDEISDQALTLLPGATVQRLLLWRYLLLWTKPYGRGLLD